MPLAYTVYPLTRSRTLLYVAGYALLMSAYAGLPVWKEYSPYRDVGDLPTEIHAALTLVLGWLLVFRTNTAYSRWWEARTLWGALVNASRNLALKIDAIARWRPEDRAELERLIIAFAAALRDHLRDEAQLNKLPGFREDSRTPVHVPAFLVRRLYEIVWRAKYDDRIDGDELRVLDSEALRLMDVCGGCERIRNTRIAYSYRVFARQCVFLFLGTFPWAIVGTFDAWTIPLTGIISYFMLGMEVVAEHVEEPFGYDDDDLDLDQLCEVIRISVSEIMADRAVSTSADG